MNFSERTTAIGTLLREHILPRYKRPEHLDDTTARAELADMVSDLNAAWPVMSETRFGDVADGLARAIRVTHTSRSWPTIAALVKALQVSITPPAAPSDEANVRDFLYGLVVEWWGKHQSAMPSVAKEHHAARMVSEGIASAGTLRRAGFRIPEHLEAEALAEPDPKHQAILADIRATGDRLRENGAPKGDIRRTA